MHCNLYEHVSVTRKKQMMEDLHPAPATESMQGTEGTTIGIAALVRLHVPIVLETVCCPAYDNTRTPETLATQSEGTATTPKALLKTGRHFPWR